MINKVPGRRGGAVSAAAAETARLTVSGGEVGAVKQVLVGLMKELSIGHATVTGDAEVTLEIDPRAFLLCSLYVRGLQGSERVAKEAQVTSEQLAAVQLRARALVVLLGALQSLRAQLAGSRLIVAAAQGNQWEKLVAGLQGDLSSEALSLEARTKLKSAAAEVLVQVEREQGQQKQRQEELKGARDAAQSQVAAAAARQRRLVALLNMQDEQEIDPEMIDELQRIYEGQVRIPGEEQRRAPR